MTDVSRVQGVIVAAPVFAATGSRWKAMGIAIASVRLLDLIRNSAPPLTARVLCQYSIRSHAKVHQNYGVVYRGFT